MVYKIELISNNRIILVTMDANYGNFTNKTSLKEWNDCMDEIESVKNKHLYDSKPVIFTSKESSKCFCGGADLKSGGFSTPIAGIKYLSNTIKRICTMQRRTIAKVHGHAIGAGFFIALACDDRFGLNDNNIIISIPEVDIGLSYPSFCYLMTIGKLPNFAWKVFLNNINYKYSPQEALTEGYFNKLYDTKHALLNGCIQSALQLHPDTLECYLSVKNYFLENTILKQWNNEKEKQLIEWNRCRELPQSIKRRFGVYNAIVNKKKKSKM